MDTKRSTSELSKTMNSLSTL